MTSVRSPDSSSSGVGGNGRLGAPPTNWNPNKVRRLREQTFGSRFYVKYTRSYAWHLTGEEERKEKETSKSIAIEKFLNGYVKVQVSKINIRVHSLLLPATAAL